jgi:hypothetical protein
MLFLPCDICGYLSNIRFRHREGILLSAARELRNTFVKVPRDRFPARLRIY